MFGDRLSIESGRNLPKTKTAAGIAPDRHFDPDDRKTGGAYVTVTGRMQHISVSERLLVMEDGTVIPLDAIVSLTGGDLNLPE